MLIVEGKGKFVSSFSVYVVLNRFISLHGAVGGEGSSSTILVMHRVGVVAHFLAMALDSCLNIPEESMDAQHIKDRSELEEVRLLSLFPELNTC